MTFGTRMKLAFARCLGPLAKVRRDEDGSATVEFAILFPAFMMVFLASFESGLLMTRQVMLDRGLDLAVRSVRLGTAAGPIGVSELKRLICNGAAIIPDCLNQVKVEMRPIDPFQPIVSDNSIPRRADCVDRDDPAIPERNYYTGTSNEMMILRVCALIDPFFPTATLGQRIATESGNTYGLVSTSAFVMEPG